YLDLGGQPANGPVWPCIGWGLPSRRVTATLVRSYRTVSPLPISPLTWGGATGGFVSVALSRGFPRVGPPTTSPCDVRTFLEDPERPPRLLGLPHHRSAPWARCEAR